MGIIKISDQVHDDIRRASVVMTRSINAQAEFWIKIGRLAERNPTKTFSEIIQMELERADEEGMDEIGVSNTKLEAVK